MQIIEKTVSLAEADEQKATAYFWAGTVYEERDELDKAADNWQLLLDLPEKATTDEQRSTAEEHLLDIRTTMPAPTSTRTRTPTATKPVTATRTPTRTPTPSPTP